MHFSFTKDLRQCEESGIKGIAHRKIKIHFDSIKA